MMVMLMWRGDDGSHGGAAVVVTRRWWLWRGGGVEGCGVGGCGGEDGGMRGRRVVKSDIWDQIDRVVGSIFGFAGKVFRRRRVVAGGGGRRWPSGGGEGER
nr:hypothetical protein [Tanacetum cinerariifolium]